VTGEFVKNSGLATIGMGIGLMFVGLDWEVGLEGSPVSWLGIPLMFGGMLLNFRGRRVSARELASSAANPLLDARPDVLYLRAFRSDASGMKRALRGGLTTAEEDLAEALRPIGDLVTVGQPDERLPLPGATRMYVSDQEWKAVVGEQMRHAALVVVRVGSGGAGLLWECSEAFTTLRPEQLVLLILDVSFDDCQEFIRRVHETFHVTLPDIPRSDLLRTAIDVRQNRSRAMPGFVTFTRGWNARFLPLPHSLQFGYRDLVKPFREALRPVFEARGVSWARGVRWTQP
jgi:hypothetical protein